MKEKNHLLYKENLKSDVTLLESEALTRRNRNVAYLMELDVENLLFPYRYESGLHGSLNYKKKELHGGWDAPTSHIRGTFTGHFLSAAALLCKDGEERLLRAKAEYIVDEIRKCQEQNGGGWAFPIPEKYVRSVREGKHFWAPLYVCHKVMMGLLDMGRLLSSKTADTILEGCTEWFEDFLENTSEEKLANMMKIEETGGIMEFWADYYDVSGDERHLNLMRRFERKELFDALLEKKDVLTNMHANTTIPEIHGAARAYEVTGEERYRKIVENYWELAVTKRGMYATGGQTCGEVWTPMMRQSARLGDQNQEHCVVYNMIRLADYLLRFTGKAEYGDYIERNTINGIFAQGFFQARALDSYGESVYPKTGTVAYYLPLMAGGQKHWGKKTEDFWCCHCTLVQANARLWEYIYYRNENGIAISQYIPSKCRMSVNGTNLSLEMKKEDAGVGCIEINDLAINGVERPREDVYIIEVEAASEIETSISLRIPWWIQGEVVCYMDGVRLQIGNNPDEGTKAAADRNKMHQQSSTPVRNEKMTVSQTEGYLTLHGCWNKNRIRIVLPKGLHMWPLADEPGTAAFLDGPVVLAGLVAEERILYGDANHPETMLKPHNERVWGSWTNSYKTYGQQNGFYLKPLYEIGEEAYTVYFPIRSEE